MPSIESPVAGMLQKLRPKSERKPLQPIKNTPTNIPIENGAKPNPKQLKQESIDISPIKVSNKENHSIYATPTKEIQIESIDVSLAEELSAIRKKVERLRLDKEKTEKKLKERDVALDCWVKDMEQRCEVQKMLEIQVDRLFRLMELKSSSIKTHKRSPIRSLREKEAERKTKKAQQQDVKVKDKEGSVGESALQSPSVGESALQSPNPESSELVTELKDAQLQDVKATDKEESVGTSQSLNSETSEHS